MLHVASLNSLGQQWADLREFVKEFSSAAEELNYNNAALKELCNYALDESFSMEVMVVLEHLSFVAFVDFLGHRKRQSVP